MTAKRHLSAVPDDDEPTVAVIVPARWMQDIRDKLDRLLVLRAEGPLPAKPTPLTQYLTSKQVAARTNHSYKTVRRWVRSGKLTAYGPCGDRFKLADVDRLMSALPPSATDEDREIAEAHARLHADDGDE